MPNFARGQIIVVQRCTLMDLWVIIRKIVCLCFLCFLMFLVKIIMFDGSQHFISFTHFPACCFAKEELCWDSARDEGGRPLPRRWHLKMHLGRPLVMQLELVEILDWTTDLVFTELFVLECLKAIWGLYIMAIPNCPSLPKLFFSFKKG